MNKKLFQAKAYLLYLFRSKKGTHAHSPFAFDLARNVIYQKPAHDVCFKAENYRQRLYTDKFAFNKTDLGTGRSKSVIVNELARSSSIKRKYGELLSRLVQHQNPGHILEFGTCLGMSTYYLSFYNNSSTTVEGCQNTQQYARNALTKVTRPEAIKKINFQNTDFDSFLAQNKQVFDFIFIDGNHAYEPTISYFQQLWLQLPENGLIILDDIHWSVDMQKAWHFIQKQTENLISIDLFQIGLCFKRASQVKEHFIFRY